METVGNIRPKQVHVACYLLWGCLALGFLYQVLEAGGISNQVALNYIIVVALWGYLIVGIRNGRNSARILAGGLFFLGLFLAPPSVRELATVPIQGAVSLVQFAMQLAALALIFVAPGNSWFAASRSRQSQPNPVNGSVELLKAIEATKQKDTAPPN